MNYDNLDLTKYEDDQLCALYQEASDEFNEELEALIVEEQDRRNEEFLVGVE
tara:strand:+ start:455 stop:610 length:156 start_codon:yes stop_codon:yes gene_type:complete